MDEIAGPVLLADVGGTNARFAFLADGKIGPIVSVLVADYPRFDHAMAAFLARAGGPASVRGAVLAVAGPVENGRAAITNSGWIIDAQELRGIFALEQVQLLNDFEAVAWSLPNLGSGDLVQIGSGGRLTQAPAVAVGAGTGLGLACFVPTRAEGVVISTEGGHATLPATCAREDAVIAHLRERFGHVSAERAVSGDGLVNLYQALAAVDGRSVPARSATEITDAGRAGRCATSREALDMFCAMLGTVAGNAALTFGARGGVYIAGGIAPRITDHLARSEFRRRFEAKGRFSRYVASIASSVIVHSYPAFVGMRSLAMQQRTRWVTGWRSP